MVVEVVEVVFVDVLFDGTDNAKGEEGPELSEVAVHAIVLVEGDKNPHSTAEVKGEEDP